MGRWDNGLFDNDDAADWAYELEDVGLRKGIRATLDRLERDTAGNYMEMPDCEVTVALAAVMAEMKGLNLDVTFPEDIPRLLQMQGYNPRSDEVSRCLSLLDIALGSSAEINEEGVWGSVEDHAQWRMKVESVRVFLRQLPAEQKKRGCLGFRQ